MQLMATCKEIYDEAAPVAFGENQFEVAPKNGGIHPTFRHISEKEAVHFKHLVTYCKTGPLLALHGFKNLQTLIFAHLETCYYWKPAPKALLPGSTVTTKELRTLGVKHIWELPNPPESIFDQCCANQLKISLVVGLERRPVANKVSYICDCMASNTANSISVHKAYYAPRYLQHGRHTKRRRTNSATVSKNQRSWSVLRPNPHQIANNGRLERSSRVPAMNHQ